MNGFCYLLGAGALWFVTVVTCARPVYPPPDRLQAALDKRVQQYDVKGASAAVLFPDGTIWRGVSGISHPDVKMSPDMAFAIGSITKNMVAALMLQLAEEGELSLEDPIGKWLPSYPHVNPAITIRQMLNHTSGLFMFWDNQALWDDLIRYRTKHFTPEEVLGYLKEPPFRPGESYQYSNTGYLLAAMIITRATGSTLAVEMRKRFWQPLDLRSARLPLEEPYPENLAHVWGDNFEKDGSCRDITFLPRVSHDSITYGSAGVFMTAEDLARWTHALFHGKVIGEDSLREMQAFGRGSYGLGLGRFGFEVGGGFTALGHGGANIGTGAYMIYLPDYEVSIAVMVNRCFSGCDTRIARDLSRIAALSFAPKAYFDLLWSPLGFLAGLWSVGGVGAAIYGFRKDKPLILVVFGGLALVAGWFSIDNWTPLDLVLFTVGGVVGALGLALFMRRLGHHVRSAVVAVPGLLLTVVGAEAQPPVVPENIKTTVRQRVDYGYCPSIVVGLMNTNGCAYFSYGNVDLDGGPAVDENTLFETGSIGKVFTTTLLADKAQCREVEPTDTIHYLGLSYYRV
ncbi:MAG TPA: serine hydrolase [Candidatus Paceibacterota bacterium]|nr:serine hydrolase [Verrucomicrobiota bacterium]HRY50793.1 serine hydrolase [Candidatus Paceibacterota bacterium]HSA00061.1 serine hydrolase [Candidatus Paceibacterota bacterium]